MICFPNAKINFGLSIDNVKRSDRLHNINSIFLPIKLCDALEVIEYSNQTENIQINYSGLVQKIDNDLCVKAYNLLHNDFNIPKVKVYLHKCIPIGSGLGGGSSNAVHMLKILNNMFKLKLTKKDLLIYAIKLGSDCSFFVYNEPSIVSGFGNLIKPFRFRFVSKIHIENEFKLVLVIPKKISISTASIFSHWDKTNNQLYSVKNQKLKTNTHQEGLNINLIESIINQYEYVEDYVFWNQLPISESEKRLNNNYENNNRFSYITNELEDSVFFKYPDLKTIKFNLMKKGALYASMSGSGSVFYAIFSKKNNLGDLSFLKDDFLIWEEDFNYN